MEASRSFQAYKAAGPQDGERRRSVRPKHAGGRVRLLKKMLPVPSYYYNGKKTRPDEEPHLRVPKDIHPETALKLREQLREMEKDRKRNSSLEEAREEGKRRITVKDVMSEQQMFQEEHLKLQREHHLLKKCVLNVEKRLKILEETLAAHLEMRTTGGSALLAPAIGLQLLSGSTSGESVTVTQSQKDDVICTICGKLEESCKCWDFVYDWD